MRCPVGRNRIFVDDPPYGDARRQQQLLRESPDLYHEVQRLGPAARAARLEAKDRGIIAQVQQSAVERALRRTRPTMAPPREPSPIEQGIQTLLLERVGQGATATQVIEDLTTMMASDPTAYACQLGEAIPDMEGHLAGPARQFAALLVSLYGRLERSERTLWEMWRRIPPDDRKRARERGRPSGGDALH